VIGETALAIRNRPKRFADIIGQEFISELQARVALRERRSYLFEGETGTGKTTVASVTARAYRCEENLDGEPCLQCENCVAFESGNEIGFTSFSPRVPVQRVMASLDNSTNRLLGGGYRVLYFEEAHALHSFIWDRLLEELENPRERIFLFSTNHPHLVPAPVRNRLTTYSLRRVPREILRAHLREVCRKESVPFDETGLDLLSSASKGDVRQSLKYLDKANALGGATAEVVRRALTAPFAGRYVELLALLFAGTEAQVVEVANQIDVAPSTFADQFRSVVVDFYEAEMLQTRGAGLQLFGVDDELKAKASETLKRHADAMNLRVADLVTTIATELESDAGVKDEPWLKTKLLRLPSLFSIKNVKQPPKLANRNLAKRPRIAGFSGRDAGYLPSDKCVSIIEAASFLPQVYGRLFNLRLLFLHDRAATTPELGVKVVSDCLQQLAMAVKRWSQDGAAHYIYLHQNSCAVGFNTCVLLSVPDDCLDQIKTWVECDFIPNRTDGRAELRAYRAQVCRSPSPAGHRAWHWWNVRLLLRNVDPASKITGAGAKQPLVDALRVQKRARENLGPCITPHVVRMSRSINEQTRSMTEPKVLSAFADGALDHLTTCWELEEYKDREAFAADYADQLRALGHDKPADSILARELRASRTAEIEAERLGDPKRRKRGWQPWFIDQ